MGLVLGSGAARGMAHIGVLRALLEHGIKVDLIAGSSIGALIGAYFAKFGEIERMEELVLNMDFREMLKLVDPNPALLLKGLITGNRVEEFLNILIGDVNFDDLNIPLSVVATDVDTGEEVVLDKGNLIKAVRASISIPAIFTPVIHTSGSGGSAKESSPGKERFLIDGGVVNPVPVNIAKNMGADFIIACNVVQKPQKGQTSLITGKGINPSRDRNPLLNRMNSKISELIEANRDKLQNINDFINNLKKTVARKTFDEYSRAPNIFEVLLQAIYVMEYEIAQLNLKQADVTINPELQNIGALEFHRAEECITKGYQKAKEIISGSSKLAGIKNKPAQK